MYINISIYGCSLIDLDGLLGNANFSQNKDIFPSLQAEEQESEPRKRGWVAIACESSKILTCTCSESLNDWKGWPPRFWNWGTVMHPGWQTKLWFCSFLSRPCYKMVQNFLLKNWSNILSNCAALHKFRTFSAAAEKSSKSREQQPEGSGNCRWWITAI